jgi:hypothetical protein
LPKDRHLNVKACSEALIKLKQAEIAAQTSTNELLPYHALIDLASRTYKNARLNAALAGGRAL